MQPRRARQPPRAAAQTIMDATCPKAGSPPSFLLWKSAEPWGSDRASSRRQVEWLRLHHVMREGIG
jgi:hypothetical protein